MTAVFGRVGNPVFSSSFFLNSVNNFASSLRSTTSTRFGGVSSFTLFRLLGVFAVRLVVYYHDGSRRTKRQNEYV